MRPTLSLSRIHWQRGRGNTTTVESTRGQYCSTEEQREKATWGQWVRVTGGLGWQELRGFVFHTTGNNTKRKAPEQGNDNKVS